MGKKNEIVEQEEIIAEVVEDVPAPEENNPVEEEAVEVINPVKSQKQPKKSKTKGTDFTIDSVGMITLIIAILIIPPLNAALIKPIIDSFQSGQHDLVAYIVVGVCALISFFIIFAEGHHDTGREQEEQLIGLFPAVGMWGTFIGVAQALIGFDINGGEQSLNVLVQGLQTAVYTTVWGMTFFIWWSGILLVKEKFFDKGVEHDPALAILNNISEKMAEHMESFTKEINDKIVDTLGVELRNFSDASKNLLEWYQQGMTKYTKSVKEMDGIYQKIQDTLTTLSKEISETLQSMFETNGILENRNEMLIKQGELTEKWVDNVKEVNDSVIKTSGVLNESLAQYQERFSTALEEASKVVVVNIQQLSEQYQIYFDERQKDTENLANALNEDRKENMVVLKQEIEDQLMHIKNAIETCMTATLNEFSKQMVAISNNYHENMSTMLEGTTQKNQTSFDLLQDNIQKTGEFVKNSQQHLNTTFDKINALVDNKIKVSENKFFNKTLGRLLGNSEKSGDNK